MTPTDATEPVPTGATDRRPSLLRRPWLGWVVAGVVLLAALGVGIWLASDRAALQAEQAMTAARLRQSQQRITRLSRSLERAADRSAGLSRGVQTCVGALDDQVELFNALVRELNAIRVLNQDQAEAFHRRAVELRRTANRSLARCRAEGAGR